MAPLSSEGGDASSTTGQRRHDPPEAVWTELTGIQLTCKVRSQDREKLPDGNWRSGVSIKRNIAPASKGFAVPRPHTIQAPLGVDVQTSQGARQRLGKPITGSGIPFVTPENQHCGIRSDEKAPLQVRKPDDSEDHRHRGQQNGPVSMFGRICQHSQQNPMGPTNSGSSSRYTSVWVHGARGQTYLAKIFQVCTTRLTVAASVLARSRSSRVPQLVKYSRRRAGGGGISVHQGDLSCCAGRAVRGTLGLDQRKRWE